MERLFTEKLKSIREKAQITNDVFILPKKDEFIAFINNKVIKF